MSKQIPNCLPIKVNFHSKETIVKSVTNTLNKQHGIHESLGCQNIACSECAAENKVTGGCVLQDGVSNQMVLQWLLDNPDLWEKDNE